MLGHWAELGSFCIPLDQAEVNWAILSFKVTQEFLLFKDPAGMDQHQPLCRDTKALG